MSWPDVFVFAEAEIIVEAGELDPNGIHLPGINVDKILKAAENEKPIEHLKVQQVEGHGGVTAT